MEVAPSDLPGKVHVQPLSALTPARRQAILTLKSELLAVLDLEQRIRDMGTRWNYSPDDLADALASAAADPAGWLMAVVADEELTAKCKRAGLRWPI
jgi:hypothetical protein